MKKIHISISNLIQSLLTLAIIGIISGSFLPATSFAGADQTLILKNVTDTLQEVGDAFNTCSIEKGAQNCSVLPKDLVTAGFLKAIPVLPVDISIEGQRPADFEDDDPGVIGGRTEDGKLYAIISIYPVPVNFCKAFNNYHGHGNIVIQKCNADGAGCSGSRESSDIPTVKSPYVCVSGDDLRLYTNTPVPNN